MQTEHYLLLGTAIIVAIMVVASLFAKHDPYEKEKKTDEAEALSD